MRKFIVASHGYMAKGLVHTAEMVLGKLENLNYICAYVDDGRPFEESIRDAMEEMEAGDEMIIMTDIYGGSVCNTFLSYINNRQIYQVAGMNLPLLIELVTNPLEDTRELIRQAVAKARASICEPAAMMTDLSATAEEF